MSHPASNVASYDLSLLHPVSGPITGTTPVEKLPDPSTAGYNPGSVSYARKDESAASKGHEAVVASVPWYRTRRGMVIIAVAVLVIIGAVVGGAVGGTHHSLKRQSDTSGPQSPDNATEQGQQSNGVGAAPSSSGVASNPAGQGSITARTTSSTSTSTTTTSSPMG